MSDRLAYAILDALQYQQEESFEPFKGVASDSDDIIQSEEPPPPLTYTQRRSRWEREGETFTAMDIWIRDEGLCHLCSIEVDPLLNFPDPLSRSIDHLIPFSLGGEHQISNARLAHIKCNLLRRNTPLEELDLPFANPLH